MSKSSSCFKWRLEKEVVHETLSTRIYPVQNVLLQRGSNLVGVEMSVKILVGG